MKSTFIALLALCLCLPLVGADKEKTDVERRGYKFEFTGKVVSVHDGDTITVLLGKERVSVRISAVDCPEVRAYFGKGGQQPYSRQAAQFTEKLVGGKMVKVKTIGKSRNRVVGIVTLPDGRRLGRELLAAGYGWLDPRFSKDAGLLKAQAAAKKAKRGLWVGNTPVAPWEWRKRPYTGTVVAGAIRILSLLPNPKGKDAGNEQVTLVNTSKKAVSLRGWSLRDKAKNVYGLSGSIAANGRRVITMKSNSMPLNNDGDTIMLVQGNTSRHSVSYTKKQAGNGAVVKAGK